MTVPESEISQAIAYLTSKLGSEEKSRAAWKGAIGLALTNPQEGCVFLDLNNDGASQFYELTNLPPSVRERIQDADYTKNVFFTFVMGGASITWSMSWEFCQELLKFLQGE